LTWTTRDEAPPSVLFRTIDGTGGFSAVVLAASIVSSV
jgi:hypothetical protein